MGQSNEGFEIRCKKCGYEMELIDKKESDEGVIELDVDYEWFDRKVEAVIVKCENGMCENKVYMPW